MRLFLSGDVMTGRGIDQVLPHPSDPLIHEARMRSAEGYVELAERRNGPIPRHVDWDYIWGDALAELKRQRPDVRIVNLETAVTVSDDWQPRKGINYRMNPKNVPCLTAAGLDCCVLANNHVLDWGIAGMEETLESLHRAGIHTAGVGRNAQEAARPAVVATATGRVRVFAFGSSSAGVPVTWRASSGHPGINPVKEEDPREITRIAALLEEDRRAGDIDVVSIHWGANWSYPVTTPQRRLAHALIDEAGASIVHGHSSHHARGIEVHNNHLILYGCGDLLNDYEGITRHTAFRGELGMMYFADVDPTNGELIGLNLTPTRMMRFQVTRAGADGANWLGDMLDREGKLLGTRVARREGAGLTLEWK